MGQGQCPVKRYNRELRDLIIHERANPSLIVSHELPLTRHPRPTTSSTSGSMATKKYFYTPQRHNKPAPFIAGIM
jgi:hypothetical protein